MTTDPIAAAIDHIRSVTNRAWCAEDFEDIPGNPVDASIATILNAVVSGQLINRASRDEMLAEARAEGWRTGQEAMRERAANRDLWLPLIQEQSEGEWTQELIEQDVVIFGSAIRALPIKDLPKENDHG